MSVTDRGAPLFDSNPTRDYNHASDSTYKRLRAEADELYERRNKLSQQSQHAYKSGDGARAHELSEQSKQLLKQAESKNHEAAMWVFRENNADSAEDEIDLHGLYVKEAEYFLQNRIAHCIRTNQSHVRVIVGKGLHSKGGIAKLKPAIDQMCNDCQLRHRMDPHNSGVLIVDLSNTQEGQIPSSWNASGAGADNIGQPQPAHLGSGSGPQYQGQNGPQYYPQQQQQQQQSNDFKTGNVFVDFVLKAFCMCINSK